MSNGLGLWDVVDKYPLGSFVLSLFVIWTLGRIAESLVHKEPRSSQAPSGPSADAFGERVAKKQD